MGNGGWCTIEGLLQELHSDHSVFVYGVSLSAKPCALRLLLSHFALGLLGVIKSTVLVRLFMSYLGPMEGWAELAASLFGPFSFFLFFFGTFWSSFAVYA